MRPPRSFGWLFGSLLVAGSTVGASQEATPAGVPVQALIASLDGGLVDALLIEWRDGAPILAAIPGGKALPSGAIAWFSLPGLAPQEPSPNLVRLFPEGTLGGVLSGGDEEGEYIEFRGTPLGALEVPIDLLHGLLFTQRTSGWEFEDLLARGGPRQEVLLVPARQGFDTLPGFLFRVSPEALHFAVGQAREPTAFPFSRVAALIRGTPPEEQHPSAASDCRLGFLDGTWIPARANRLAAGRLEISLPWGPEAQVPLTQLAGVDFRGEWAFLSELTPSGVEQTPFLGSDRPTLFPWARDRSCVGTPLISGRPWTRGIGCHARTRLTFDLDGKWKGFFTLVGVDDSALGLPVPGDFSARVFLDGELVWERERVRGGEPPVPVGPVSVVGRRRLMLEVDYGHALHIGDRANWLLPLLFR